MELWRVKLKQFEKDLVFLGMIGIYKITSPSGKIYIGQTINIEKRKSYYACANCKKQRKLYHSIIKHGFDKHTFDVVCYCDETQLNELEDYYINLYNSINCGLNLKTAGSRGRLSDESKMRISIANKGKKNALGTKRTDDQKRRISEGNKGKPPTFKGRKHTEQTKALMSKKAKGRKHFLGKNHTEETKSILSKLRLGIVFTEEHKKKLSDSHKGQRTWLGRKHSPESIEKMRLAKIGKKASKETKQKMSESHKKRFAI